MCLCAAIVPPGLDKPDDMVLTQKATLERTSEWAEKAAALISSGHVHSSHRPSASDSSKDAMSHHRSNKQTTESLHSPLGSPSGVNPRDIPLELRGGSAHDPRDPPPRDPRDRSPRGDRDDREPGEIPDERLSRTEQRRESRDIDASSRQYSTRDDDRTDHRPNARTEKDQDLDRITPDKDFESTDRDVDLEFDTWESSKSPERKRTDSKTKLSTRSQSPSSRLRDVSKRPSSGRVPSDRGLEDDTEPGMHCDSDFFFFELVFTEKKSRNDVCKLIYAYTKYNDEY